MVADAGGAVADARAARRAARDVFPVVPLTRHIAALGTSQLAGRKRTEREQSTFQTTAAAQQGPPAAFPTDESVHLARAVAVLCHRHACKPPATVTHANHRQGAAQQELLGPSKSRSSVLPHGLCASHIQRTFGAISSACKAVGREFHRPNAQKGGRASQERGPSALETGQGGRT